jgi:hypothetical protein
MPFHKYSDINVHMDPLDILLREITAEEKMLML